MTDYNSLNKSAIETQVSEDIKDQSTNFEGNTKTNMFLIRHQSVIILILNFRSQI
jgi:hypothetical protein